MILNTCSRLPHMCFTLRRVRFANDFAAHRQHVRLWKSTFFCTSNQGEKRKLRRKRSGEQMNDSIFLGVHNMKQAKTEKEEKNRDGVKKSCKHFVFKNQLTFLIN